MSSTSSSLRAALTIRCLAKRGLPFEVKGDAVECVVGRGFQGGTCSKDDPEVVEGCGAVGFGHDCWRHLPGLIHHDGDAASKEQLGYKQLFERSRCYNMREKRSATQEGYYFVVHNRYRTC